MAAKAAGKTRKEENKAAETESEAAQRESAGLGAKKALKKLKKQRKALRTKKSESGMCGDHEPPTCDHGVLCEHERGLSRLRSWRNHRNR